MPKNFQPVGVLEPRNAELGRDPVGGAAGRHGPRDAAQTPGIAGRQMGVGGQQRQTVARRDEQVGTHDHVAVAVAIGRGAEVRRVRPGHGRHQIMGVDRVGVRVMAAEVGQGCPVQHGPRRSAQALFQDLRRIGAGDGAERVEHHAELSALVAAAEQRADLVEVEQAFHQLGIVGDRIDDLDRHAFQLGRAQPVEVDIRRFHRAVFGDLAGPLEYRVGDPLRRRAAVAGIVLDAEIAVGAALVVAGRQDDAAERLVLADDVGGGRASRECRRARSAGARCRWPPPSGR